MERIINIELFKPSYLQNYRIVTHAHSSLKRDRETDKQRERKLFPFFPQIMA